jgi:phosphotransferase system enzyme I (PtsI)
VQASIEPPRRGVYEAFGTYRKLLGGAGEYMAARIADLDDIRDRWSPGCSRL